MNTQQALLLVAVGLIATGSSLTGFMFGKMSKRGRHKGRHAKGRGRHAR